MAEFLDYAVGIQAYADPVQSVWNSADGDGNTAQNSVQHRDTWYKSVTSTRSQRTPNSGLTGKTFLEVRPSICVTGFHREAIQRVKKSMSQLQDEPVALESFHVHRLSDTHDGSLLVPKIVLVAVHCPGKKLLDEEGNEGQLDYLYDEVCDLGAEVMVVYLDLPRTIYPPFRHMVYHPKMAEILFPSQPILRELAESNCFITVTEGSDLTNMQKNVLKEWMRKPVDNTHQIYKSAECLSGAEWSDAEFYSEPDSIYRSHSYPATSTVNMENEFMPAVESHPLANPGHKKKRKSKNLFRLGRRKRESELEQSASALVIMEDEDVELELYNGNSSMGSYQNSYSNLSL